MTRPFNQQVHCPNCQTIHTWETLFGRWLRNNPKLDSQSGYSITDQDYWVHRYKICNSREFQLLMLIEVKTQGAKMTPAQLDTLYAANQLMRNRRQTPTKEMRHQSGTSPLTVHSTMIGRKVEFRAYGMYVLTFSHLGPDDSEWIKWNKRMISEDQLTAILAFDLDPDRLVPIDDSLRKHHSPRQLDAWRDSDDDLFSVETE